MAEIPRTMLVPLCGCTPFSAPTTTKSGDNGPHQGLPGPPFGAALGPEPSLASRSPRLYPSNPSDKRGDATIWQIENPHSTTHTTNAFMIYFSPSFCEAS